MKNLFLLLIIILSFTGCDSSPPKDPWPGIGKPQLIGQSIGKDKRVGLHFHLEIREVGKVNQLTVSTQCSSSVYGMSRKNVSLDPTSTQTIYPIYYFLPNKAIVFPKGSTCTFMVSASNSLGSTSAHQIENLSLSDLVPPINDLNMNLDERVTEQLKPNEISFFHVDSKISGLHKPILVCDKSKEADFFTDQFAPDRDSSFATMNYQQNLKFPIQFCKVISQNPASRSAMISSTFMIKGNVPRPHVVHTDYLPRIDKRHKIFYDSSDSISLHLLQITLKNPYSFSLYYELTAPLFDFEIHVLAGFKESTPVHEASFQPLPATLIWLKEGQLIEDSHFALQPDESITLSLYLQTNFNCASKKMFHSRFSYYHDRSNQLIQMNPSLGPIPEIGFYLELPKNHPVLQIKRLQKEPYFDSLILSNDDILNAYKFRVQHSDTVTPLSPETFIEEFFYRQSRYHIEAPLLASPKSAFDYDKYIQKEAGEAFTLPYICTFTSE